MKVQDTVSFNHEAVKKMSEAQFLKLHEHHAEDVNLKEIYEKIVGKAKPADKAEVKGN